MFERKHVVAAEKLAAQQLKQCQNEDPQTALIATAMTLACAARACGMKRQGIIMLIDALENSLNDAHSEAHGAMNTLIVPR